MLLVVFLRSSEFVLGTSGGIITIIRMICFFCIWFLYSPVFNTISFSLSSSNHNIIPFIYNWFVGLKWIVRSYGDGVYLILFQALRGPGCVVNRLSIVDFDPTQKKFNFSSSLAGVTTRRTHVDEIWYWNNALLLYSTRGFQFFRLTNWIKTVPNDPERSNNVSEVTFELLEPGLKWSSIIIYFPWWQVFLSRIHRYRCFFIFSLVFELAIYTLGYGVIEWYSSILLLFVLKSVTEKQLMIERNRCFM